MHSRTTDVEFSKNFSVSNYLFHFSLWNHDRKTQTPKRRLFGKILFLIVIPKAWEFEIPRNGDVLFCTGSIIRLNFLRHRWLQFIHQTLRQSILAKKNNIRLRKFPLPFLHQIFDGRQFPNIAISFLWSLIIELMFPVAYTFCLFHQCLNRSYSSLESDYINCPPGFVSP